MNTTRLCLVLSLAGAVVTTGLCTQAAKEDATHVIREQEEQVVLYTIHRGEMNEIGSIIARLNNLARQNHMVLAGPVTLVYLTNFGHTSSKHWLTEVRLPVGKEALKVAGTLGPMTDVKVISPLRVAVITKPEGVADPRPLYVSLYLWMGKHGYVPDSRPQETCKTNTMGSDYAQMRTEITLPIWDLSSEPN